MSRDWLTKEEEAAILRRLIPYVDYEDEKSVNRAIKKGKIKLRLQTTFYQDQFLMRKSTRNTSGQKYKILIQYEH